MLLLPHKRFGYEPFFSVQGNGNQCQLNNTTEFLGPAAIIMTFNMLNLRAVWASPEGPLNPKVLSCQTVVQALSLFHCLANPILYNFLSRSFCGNLIADLARHLPSEAVARGRDENHVNVKGGQRPMRRQRS
ncbi:unnamed protein product [Coregonus sp. 'balchen']|nr:unnamed protein product [Coregonus sp. 'balchen']